jgi:hypothetical protein
MPIDPNTKFLMEELARYEKMKQSIAYPGLPSSMDPSSIRRITDELTRYQMPEIPEMPVFEPIQMPSSEERNEYQSAAVLLQELATTITTWRAALSETMQPAVVALLQGGVQVQVQNLAQISFHGIRIEGRINGKPCVLLSHQASIQILCLAEEIAPPETPRRPIGFIIDGQLSTA